jgi:hypothetical protein
MASCVREQALFIVKLGESVLQVPRKCGEHFKTSKMLVFKFPFLSGTDVFLIYSTLPFIHDRTVHQHGRK